MAQSSERMERVQSFIKLIEDNVITSISASIELDRLRRRARSRDKRRQPHELERYFGHVDQIRTFRIPDSIGWIPYQRNNFTSVPAGEKVVLSLMTESKKTAIFAGLERYLRAGTKRSEVDTAATPSLRMIKIFCITGCDRAAWWVREWYEEDASLTPDKMRDLDFGSGAGRSV